MKWRRKHELLKKLYQIFYGKDIDEIPEAPRKTYMEQYGEKSWTREQYDDAIELKMINHKDELFYNSIENIEVTSVTEIKKIRDE